MRAKMAAAGKKDASVASRHNQNKERNGTESEWRIAEIEKRRLIDDLMLVKTTYR